MIKLVKPRKELEKEIFDYKNEMIDNGDVSLSGCGGIDRFDNFEDFMKHLNFYADRNNIPKESSYVEGSHWLLLETTKNRVLGMVNIRHYLSDFLINYGGHIGYSIRPSERRKGYAKLQLQLALDFLKTLDVKKVLVTCDDANIGSRKTIEACGGVLENIVDYKEFKNVRRYWINNK